MLSYLAFGSNLGDSLATLKKGRTLLAERSDISLLASSKLYETKPYGDVVQDDFLNGAILVETSLTPEELLTAIHQVEADLGRQRMIHWGPRTLDIDILLYGDEKIDLPILKIPHVELTKRSFVLIPLKDIYRKKNLLGEPIDYWINASGNQNEVKLSTKEW